MSLNIHVFIATNNGLVAIQSITDLQDSALQSVITISGSTDLATISPSYHRFVQKSTGLIQSEFGVASFRANISRNIDVGNSWQLPFYLAHFIQAHAVLLSPQLTQIQHDTVQLGHGNPKPGDVVLIATGQINTSSGKIEAVNHIPEKCITASAQIKLWMKTGILVEFFIPANSAQRIDWQNETTAQQLTMSEHTNSFQYKLLPEVDCAFYPVIDTTQLKEHITQLLPSNSLYKKQSKEAASIASTNVTARPLDFLHLSEKGEKVNQLDSEGSSSVAILRNSLVTKLSAVKLRIAVIIMFIVSAATYTMLNIASAYSETRFVTITKSGLHCDANVVEKVTTVAEQYVSRIPSAALSSVCSMTLITSKKIPQVWLVADSKTLIELSFSVIDNEFYWIVPIPQQQQVDREYILIVTEQTLDLADLSAFKSYLSQLKQTQKPAVEILAMFFSQIAVNPQYVSQRLIASKN